MKTSQRVDRRVRKTQQALYLALAELMRTKDLAAITVSELAKKADIHRATFYSHYTDIEGLYRQIQDSTLDELGNIFAPDPELGKNMNSEEIFTALILFVNANREVIRMFLTQRSSSSFYHKLAGALEKMYLEIFWEELNERQESAGINVKLLATYHIHGCLAVIGAWAQRDYAEPTEKITQTLAHIDAHFDRLLYSLL